MKKILFIFFLLFAAGSYGQDYSFVNGDPKFMIANPGKNASNAQDEYILKQGLPDGSYAIFYDEAKTKVFQKGFMKDGHRIKSWAYYTMEQKPKMEMQYDESGLLSGVVKEYFPGGALMTETQFRDGQANGLMISYYENGIRKMQCGMKNNNMEGKAVFYDETGKMKQSTTIQYGEGEKK